jgi:hypothetical protein
MAFANVTVLNINDVEIEEFAQWTAAEFRIVLPKPGPNLGVGTVTPQLVELLAEIPSKMEFATELYSIVSANLSKLKEDKARTDLKDLKKEIEINLMYATAKQDIIYRHIQTLHVQYEATSRMLGALDNAARMNRTPFIQGPNT